MNYKVNSKITKVSREKQIILGARVLSMVFTPFYLPLVGLLALFLFSYLSLYPWLFKLKVIALVCLFTILLPTLFIRLYRRYNGWTLIELGQKERRMVPYVISILCYMTCVWLMELQHIPHFMASIVIAALVVQMVCAFINMFWKISTHTAAIGGFAGALFIFAEAFGFNPVWWFCLLFIVAGLLGSSRMILRQHTLLQVVAGFLVGAVCAALAILKL
jgi:membrane-associated phospholipid phosphatase